MSALSNTPLSTRDVGAFSPPRRTLTSEMRAILAGVAVAAVLVALAGFNESPELADVPITSNVEDIRMNASDADKNVPVRQTY